jgi:hypothetical protein
VESHLGPSFEKKTGLRAPVEALSIPRRVGCAYRFFASRDLLKVLLPPRISRTSKNKAYYFNRLQAHGDNFPSEIRRWRNDCSIPRCAALERIRENSNPVSEKSCAPTEQITINGTAETVHMGPYGLRVPSGDPVTYMMCFDAAANVSLGQHWTALATDTAGALAYYDPKTVQMIAWLTSQRDSTSPPTTPTNANINKAMWEIMADYGTPNGLDVTSGNFYLRNASAADLAQVDGFVDAAFNSTALIDANFLIPLTKAPNGEWILDSEVQPFFCAWFIYCTRTPLKPLMSFAGIAAEV